MATERSRHDDERLTPAQRARVDALKARRGVPEARAEDAAVREAILQELRETGRVEVAEDATTIDDLVAFRRFMMAMRKVREARGLSIDDAAARSGIERSALAKLERGATLNPTVNTLSRYVRALGLRIDWQVAEADAEHATAEGAARG